MNEIVRSMPRTRGSLALRGGFAWVKTALVSAMGLAAVACGSSGSAPPLEQDGPGATAVADVIACKQDTDCRTGEMCGNGFCQMRRCSDASYASAPPIGTTGYAYTDRAFLVGTTGNDLAIYSPHGSGPNTIQTSSTPIDLAGGNLTGARPESAAFLTSGSSNVTVVSPDGTKKDIALGFQGKRVAAGDVDGDGVDEIVVAGTGSDYAICSAVKGSCKRGTLSASPDDVAVGDVDGDGLGEVLFVGNHTLTILDVDTNKTSSQPLSANLTRITAGDLDGDGVAEIAGAEHGNLVTPDKIHVYHLSGQLSEAAEQDLDRHYSNDALDLSFGRQDDKPFLGVLSEANTLKVFAYGGGALNESSSTTIDANNARMIAAADVHGRSAALRLKAGPQVEIGPPVPIAVITLPPYSAAHSAGPSSATMGTSQETGSTTSNGDSKTHSVSLTVGGGIAIPIQAGISAGVNAFVTNTWSNTVSHSKSVSSTLSVGNSYTVTAEPEVDGYQSGGVILAGGCFHRYDYTVDDPQQVLGKSGAMLSLLVPVGGETTLWSTARYNALADALGGKLPKIDIPYRLGNVGSYPSSPTTLGGQPIPKDDNVFPNAPLTRTSDVGGVSFSLSASDSTTNTNATNFSYSNSKSVQGTLNLAVVNVNVQGTIDDTWSLDQSYSVTVGKSASFSGSVSAVRDDPNTSTNEATLYGYSFQPVVYREHFKDTNGKDGAFYVLTYATGK